MLTYTHSQALFWFLLFFLLYCFFFNNRIHCGLWYEKTSMCLFCIFSLPCEDPKYKVVSIINKSNLHPRCDLALISHTCDILPQNFINIMQLWHFTSKFWVHIMQVQNFTSKMSSCNFDILPLNLSCY